ncbi:MAG TPA: hypothetical protein VIJ78_01360 [Pseudolabrys sp.]
MVKAGQLIARLPAPAQARLRLIGQGARDLFGELGDFQAIVDAQVAFLDALASAGATHAMLGRLLAEVGIARPDGTPLPVGTISGALSRARERAAGRRAAPPASGTILQGPAVPGSALPTPAEPGTPMPKPARRRRKRPAPAAAVRPPKSGGADAGASRARSRAAAPAAASAETEFTAAPADDRTAARNSRAAAILNQLRSSK